MALYHFHVGQIGRGGGQSAIASAAYRAGEALYSEYYGETSDYTRKGGIMYTEIMLPPNAPPEFHDRQTLWNAVEEAEKHKKAQLAYSFDIALQNELSPEENIALAKQFVQEHLVSKGMIADLAVHEPDKKGEGIPNPHFHVMTTMRPLNPDGSWGSKQHREYILDENGNRQKDENGNYIFNAVHTTDWHTPETLINWREAWCNMVNEAFERKGLTVRIDHRSFEEQGIDQIPTVHEGPQVRKMEARGIHTEKGDKNRWIRATNKLITALKEKVHSIQNWIVEQKAKRTQAKEASMPVTPIDWIRLYYKQQEKKAGSLDSEKDLKEMTFCIRLLEKNNIRTMDDLEELTHSVSSQANGILSESREIDNQIRKLDNMIQLGEIVKEAKPVIDQMNAIHWKISREKFRAKNQDKIDQYQMTKRTLKEKYGVTKITLTAWKQKKSQLLQQKNDLLEKHKPLSARTNQLIMIQYRIQEAERAVNKDREHQKQIVRNRKRDRQER